MDKNKGEKEIDLIVHFVEKNEGRLGSHHLYG
jgi:hypothetical protein